MTNQSHEVAVLLQELIPRTVGFLNIIIKDSYVLLHGFEELMARANTEVLNEPSQILGPDGEGWVSDDPNSPGGPSSEGGDRDLDPGRGSDGPGSDAGESNPGVHGGGDK